LSRLSLLLIAIALDGGPSIAAENETPGQRLNTLEMSSELVGKTISYSPPGYLDAGISEDFNVNGSWGGYYYSRGPVRFSGQWHIRNNQVCVTPDKEAIVAQWFSGTRCRAVFRIPGAGGLSIEGLDPRHADEGLLPVSITNLPADKPRCPWLSVSGRSIRCRSESPRAAETSR
jgi:hypothetical protein